jgi:hypothetical protein
VDNQVNENAYAKNDNAASAGSYPRLSEGYRDCASAPHRLANEYTECTNEHEYVQRTCQLGFRPRVFQAQMAQQKPIPAVVWDGPLT